MPAFAELTLLALVLTVMIRVSQIPIIPLYECHCTHYFQWYQLMQSLQINLKGEFPPLLGSGYQKPINRNGKAGYGTFCAPISMHVMVRFKIIDRSKVA